MEVRVEIIDGPSIVAKPDRHCFGIRLVTSFRGMFAVRDRLMGELYSWADDRAIAYGHTFFRLHMVNMGGPMDIEVGVATDEAVQGDGRIRTGVLPGGRYATLTYINHGRRANGMLRDWAQEQGFTLDCAASSEGKRFGCRYEVYLTDPKSERMKTRWRIELPKIMYRPAQPRDRIAQMRPLADDSTVPRTSQAAVGGVNQRMARSAQRWWRSEPRDAQGSRSARPSLSRRSWSPMIVPTARAQT
jgi:effector-binding domain-containing protein